MHEQKAEVSMSKSLAPWLTHSPTHAWMHGLDWMDAWMEVNIYIYIYT